MAIIKLEDIIGWRDDEGDYCEECKPKEGNLKPITKDDCKDDEVIICDECEEVIE